MMGARTPEQVQAILSYIQPESLNYDDWLHIGMALKNEGYPFEIWDGWSVDDDHTQERPGKWDGFQSDSAYRMGTIIEKARQNNCPESVLFPNKTDSANTVPAPIVTETVSVLKPQSEGISLQILESCVNLGPQDQQKAFIKALFLPEEFICYESSDSEKKEFPGKYEPKQKNRRKTMTARDFVNAIKQNDSSAWDNYFQPAGMWICINPTDGKGRAIDNIKQWRHVLVESDEMDPKKQLDFLKNSGLPISAIYSSGSRSIHAAVCVNASNLEQYKARSAKIFEWCESQGFKIDKATKNTNRLTRFPGFYRGSQLQTLFYVGTAKPYEQWEAEAFQPDPEPQEEPKAEQPACAEIKVYNGGYLAKHKAIPTEWLIDRLIPTIGTTIISAPPKVGKSFFLLDACLSIARGELFIDEFETMRAKVIYLDLQNDYDGMKERIEMLDPFYNYYEEIDENPYRNGGVGSNDYYFNCACWEVGQNIMKIGNGLENQLDKVLENFPGTRLIGIDMLNKIKPDSGARNAYDAEAEMLDRLTEYAYEKKIQIVVVHHDNKQKGSTNIGAVSGSNAMTGSTTTTIHIVKEEGEPQGTFYRTGKRGRGIEFMAHVDEKHRWHYDCTTQEAKADYMRQQFNADPITEYIKTRLEEEPSGFDESASEIKKGSESALSVARVGMFLSNSIKNFEMLGISIQRVRSNGQTKWKFRNLLTPAESACTACTDDAENLKDGHRMAGG